MPAPIAFVVFVDRPGERAERLCDDLKRICSERTGRSAEVTVIDVTRDPAAAELHNVVVTPTVIRLQPEPERRVLGEFRDLDRVAAALGINGEG